jgi:uncharacterized membrane protein
MIYFLLSVGFTVALYLIMRSYPRFKVNSFQAIVFNYLACIGTGLTLTPDLGQFNDVAWTSAPTLFTLALGILFIVVFSSIGATSQKVGVSAASLASNMSLIIPVTFGLFVFKNANKEFTFLNYTGLVLALVALALGTLQKKEPTSNATQKMNALWLLPVATFLLSGSNNALINYLTMKFYAPDQTTLFMIIACIGASLTGIVLLVYRGIKNGEKISRNSVIGGIILGIPNFLSLYFLLKALGAFGNSAAFAFPIYNILTMLTSTLVAWILFGEKTSSINKIGLAVAVMAILLISYQELGWG